ncbi:MAG: glucose 1-dehydrogenase [Gammaproteobacteria bacterium]
MSTDRFSLEGKVALVSGGSRGIGEAIAHGLAEQGARVIVSSRDVAACQVVADAINAKGGEAVAMTCHAGVQSDIDAVFKAIDEQFGRIDILINNGATNPYYGPMAQTPEEAFDKTMTVNVKGPFMMTSAAVERMVKQGGGSIVTVASITAFNPSTYMGIYAMSKAALVSMTRTFANEYSKHNVRVNALAPGLTDTKFTEALQSDEKMTQQILKSIPARRMALPEDMVGGVLYLVSDAAAYTTGTTLVIDGGMIS